MASDDRNKKNIWTPSNVITITRILLVPLFVAALLCPWPEWLGLANFNEEWKRWVAAGVFVFISGTDWLDGYLARRLGLVTDFGKFMDPLADKILNYAVMILLIPEGLIPAEKCTPVYCALDDIIPFCEVFLIPYVGWYLLIVVSLALCLPARRQSRLGS